jgi:uncharacterized tellurite resistance protein B-like protein
MAVACDRPIPGAVMPIVAVVLLTAAFWVAYWFVRMGGVEHFRDKAARRKQEARKAEARELDRTASLRAVDDPRDAATVLMVLIARGGDPTPQQTAAIRETLAGVFGLAGEAVERLTQARFIAGSARSFEEAAKIYAELFKQRLTREERRELLDMVQAIARLDGPSPAQTEAIEMLCRRVGLAAA